MDIHAERLIYVIPIGLIGIYVFSRYMKHLEDEWVRVHKSQPVHPYGPPFTVVGVSFIHILTAFIIPWQYALVSYGLYIVLGGFMWATRWALWRSRYGNNSKHDQIHNSQP